MKNLVIAYSIALFCAIVCTVIGCNVQSTPAPIVEVRQDYLPAPIHEFYEDENGLHVITEEKDASGAYVEHNDILIELVDEQTAYTFAIDGWEYDLEFFRSGNPTDGITAVYVAFRGQLYSIDSHRLSPTRAAGMRKLIHN